MSQYKTSYDIKYTNELDEFLQNEVLPGLDISVDEFWKLTSEIITEFSDRNKSLLEKRKDIQKSIEEVKLKLLLKGLAFWIVSEMSLTH